MQPSERRDVTLVVGLAIAALVTFQGPIDRFLEIGRQIEEQFGLALVPGLAILVAVMLGNHRMTRLRAAARRRREAGSRDALALSNALAHATKRETVRDVLCQKLAAVVGTDRAWVVIRERGQWKPLAGGSVSGQARVPQIVETVASKSADRRTDDPLDESLDESLGDQVDGYLCFRMKVGDSVAVFGSPLGTHDDHEEWKHRLAAAATSIRMALRHAQLLTDMEDHGVVDGLTGCFNRTHGMKMLRAELKRAKRARTALSVAMFDLDYFKSVNDEYGHLCGDALLAAVGKKLQEMLRNSDIKCRYGGEEFLILLPDTPRQGAIQVGNMLRQELEKVSVEWTGQTVSITASIGIATADPGELESKALVGRADDALYRAKRAGRNRVCVDGADDSEASTETAPGEESLRRNSSSELPDASDRRQPVTTVAS